jgi:diguanylate cyclase (GGDEF)-like protein/PAS domain S-box-containing protein
VNGQAGDTPVILVADTPQDEPRLRVLYVEDNPFDADLAVRVLRQHAPQLDVQTADCLAAARQHLAEGDSPTLILCDMQLPDGDGLELLIEVRERQLAVGFVVLTGSGDEAAAVAALRAGADDYLLKAGDYLEQLPTLLTEASARWQRQHAWRSQPLRVLYAERSANDVDLLRRHLQRHAPHIRLDTVGNADEVLARFAGNAAPEDFDVLLLDFQLPGMNALELMKELPQAPGVRVPIIILTGQGAEGTAVQALKLGATDYIVKHEDSLLRLPFALEAAGLRVQLERERAALHESEMRLRQLAETIDDVFCLVDPDIRRFLYISSAYERIWGGSIAAVLADSLRWLDPVHPDDRPRLMQSQSMQQMELLEYRLKRADGAWRDVQSRSFPVYDAQGRVARVAAVVHDITDQKAQELRIQHLAYHDALTGLPNRMLVFDRLGRGLAHAQRMRTTLAVIFLDLDRFKTINDTLGHLAGDALLCQVADRLRTSVRDTDTVARLGGDEFLVVLEAMQEAAQVAHVADKLLSSMAAPFVLHGQELHVTTSLGISLYPRDGQDAETLLKYADTALYKAKDAGRNAYRFFSPEMDAQAHAQLRLENDLRRALERDEFELHYQPQIDLCTGSCVGMEALVRWRHPQRGLVLPGDFIPLAEETGLILPIGCWVLRTACAQAAAWRAQAPSGLRMAVNLSARQLQRTLLHDQVRQALAESGLPPHALELELTESSVMRDADEALDILQSLHELGVQIAIDDFGTGYSSLAYLKRFPIDRLKIDRSFIGGVESDGDAAAIVEAIIAMAHKLKLRVLAEGVETAGQHAFLQRLGCDEAQGWLFGRPLAAVDAQRRLAAERLAPSAP